MILKIVGGRKSAHIEEEYFYGRIKVSADTYGFSHK